MCWIRAEEEAAYEMRKACKLSNVASTTDLRAIFGMAPVRTGALAS